jgi:DNA-binding NtrC family response regulator
MRYYVELSMVCLRHPHLLVIDDDQDIRTLLREWLVRENFWVNDAADGQSALTLIAAGKYDLLITDLRLQGAMDGVETVKRARQHDPELRSLFISGVAAPRSENPDYDDFVTKLFNRGQFIGCVWELLYRRRGARLAPLSFRVKDEPFHSESPRVAV